MSEDDRPEKAPTRILVEGGPEVAERALKVIQASRKRLTVEHPAPWCWFEHSLIDADGQIIVSRPYGPLPDARVRTLLAIAPEMEELLREAYTNRRTDKRRPILANRILRGREILAHIDAAKAGE